MNRLTWLMKHNVTSEVIVMLVAKGGLIMIKLNTPERILKKTMYNLILDNQCEEIKLLLFKRQMKIPDIVPGNEINIGKQ